MGKGKKKKKECYDGFTVIRATCVLLKLGHHMANWLKRLLQRTVTLTRLQKMLNLRVRDLLCSESHASLEMERKYFFSDLN